MLSEINQHIPDNWQDAYNSNCTQFEVSSFREEYRKLINEVKQCVDGEINVRRVLRVQNSYAYGQFLIREQLLIALNEEQVYRVCIYCFIVNFAENALLGAEISNDGFYPLSE